MRKINILKACVCAVAVAMLSGCATPVSSEDTISSSLGGPKLEEESTEKTTVAAIEEVEDYYIPEVKVDEATIKASDPIDISKLTERSYYVKVNRAMNCITVYKADESGTYTLPVKAFACSVGDYVPSNPNSEPTPLGTYSISGKYEWCLMVDGSYGRYSCRIVGGILFHSVPYLGGMVKNGLETDQYNKLGNDASLGCIRLNVRDSKWIFDNCPSGTVVEIYDDPSTPGPLGKPATIKIPLDSPYAGWDPTDDTPENPWNSLSARIEGAKDLTFEKGEATFADVISSVKAYDKCGNDITDTMVVTGKLKFKTAGQYDITYTVTDVTGSTATQTVTMTIK